MQVATQQAAEISGILAGSAASAFMGQELDSVHIRKQLWQTRGGSLVCERVILDIGCFSFTI